MRSTKAGAQVIGLSWVGGLHRRYVDFPEDWGPKPEGPADTCPALEGVYANDGEPATHCQWMIFPPVPVPFGCSHTHDGRFYHDDADSFRIETNDSETIRITVLADQNTLAAWTLSREDNDFKCDGGRLIYRAVGVYSNEHPIFGPTVERSLGRASDGSLLMLDFEFWSSASFVYDYGRYWSRHPQWRPAEDLKEEAPAQIGPSQ